MTTRKKGKKNRRQTSSGTIPPYSPRSTEYPSHNSTRITGTTSRTKKLTGDSSTGQPPTGSLQKPDVTSKTSLNNKTTPVSSSENAVSAKIQPAHHITDTTRPHDNRSPDGQSDTSTDTQESESETSHPDRKPDIISVGVF